MTATIVQEREIASSHDSDDNDELQHLWCCDKDLSLCGLDLSDARDVEVVDEDTCVVCNLLTACSACGKRFAS